MTERKSGRDPTLRVVARPGDINFNGHIFGGWILSQMDIAGGVVASRRAGGTVATVAIEGMEFHRPILIRDWLSVYCDIVAVGRTSISVKVEISVRREGDDEEKMVTEGIFIYVAIDENTRPRPIDRD